MVCDGLLLPQDGHTPSSGAFAFQAARRVRVLDFESLYFGNAMIMPPLPGKG